MALTPIGVSIRTLSNDDFDVAVLGWLLGLAGWGLIALFAFRPNWHKFGDYGPTSHDDRACPRCGRFNPPDAARCPCGHAFESEPDRLNAALQRRHGASDEPSSSQVTAAQPNRPCPRCGISNRSAASFCRSCGASLRPPQGPRCQTAIPADSRYRCGTRRVGVNSTHAHAGLLPRRPR